MSRAYRIKVRESLSKVIHAEDSVASQLELLQILPADQMAKLLEQELKNRGFKEEQGLLVSVHEGIRVEIDANSGTVEVQVEGDCEVTVEKEANVSIYEDWKEQSRKAVEARTKEQLKSELSEKLVGKEQALQNQVTDKLERELTGLQHELGQVINKVTAEALKIKAAELGQIKSLTEDPENGSLTIVLEV